MPVLPPLRRYIAITGGSSNTRVTTGTFLAPHSPIRGGAIKAEHEHLKKMLMQLTGDYVKAVEEVTEKKDNEYLDFHARRLVEMAGHIIMGYLLLTISQRSDDYEGSAECIY